MGRLQTPTRMQMRPGQPSVSGHCRQGADGHLSVTARHDTGRYDQLPLNSASISGLVHWVSGNFSQPGIPHDW